MVLGLGEHNDIPIVWDTLNKVGRLGQTKCQYFKPQISQHFHHQVKCFSEIINIGYAVYRVHNLPWFRSLSWYFLVTSNYFFYGESLVDYFGVLVNRNDFLPFLVRYHRFISFSM